LAKRKKLWYQHIKNRLILCLDKIYKE
jgi:hypothetical protein